MMVPQGPERGTPPPLADFKARIAGGALTVGTWVKTPHPIIVEVLALTRLDCIVLDAEHAPFDRGSLDACIAAARAGGMPVDRKSVV